MSAWSELELFGFVFPDFGLDVQREVVVHLFIRPSQQWASLDETAHHLGDRSHLSQRGVEVVAVSHGIVSGLNARHLLVLQLATVNEGLQLVVLALHHLSHRLVEEILCLVIARRLVRQRSVARRGSGVVRHPSRRVRHVATSVSLRRRVAIVAHLVCPDDVRGVGYWLGESAFVAFLHSMVRWHVLVMVLVVLWIGRLLNVDVLSDVLVELVKLANFWAQNWTNELLLCFEVVVVDCVVVVEEIVCRLRTVALGVAVLTIETEFWHLLEAWVIE